jgi:hypothetical protein
MARQVEIRSTISLHDGLGRLPGVVTVDLPGVVTVDQVLSLTLPEPPGTRYVGGSWRPLIGMGATLGTLRGPAVCMAWSVEALAELWRPQQR